MISHGFETHPLEDEWKCDVCRQAKEEFEEWQKKNSLANPGMTITTTQDGMDIKSE